MIKLLIAANDTLCVSSSASARATCPYSHSLDDALSFANGISGSKSSSGSDGYMARSRSSYTSSGAWSFSGKGPYKRC